MWCWLVAIRARHAFLDHEVRVLRRVFGESPRQAHRLVCLVLATGGWCGVVRVLDVVSAADPNEAPILDVASDFLPPPRLRQRPPEASTQAEQGNESRQLPICVPEARQRPAKASAAPAETATERVRFPRRNARNRYRNRYRHGMANGIGEVCQPLAEASCGWYVDRHSATERGQLHEQHDPLLPPAGVTDALVFGPDMLATDHEYDEIDSEIAYTLRSRAQRVWFSVLRW